MNAPSKSQIKKAASTVRKFYRGEGSRPEYDHAVKVIEAYRSQFGRPMNTVNMALRRYVGRVDVEVEITQRLKKIPTIIDKLVNREATLNLASMQDIGGCRAVVKDLSGLDRLVSTIVDRRSSDIIRERDYIASPRVSGYRAYHVILNSPQDLPIEIQVRTESMHMWAETVEGFSKDMDLNFKQDGDGVMFQFLKVVADIFWFRETGIHVPPEVQNLYNELLVEARLYMFKRQSSTGGQGILPIERG